VDPVFTFRSISLSVVLVATVRCISVNRKNGWWMCISAFCKKCGLCIVVGLGDAFEEGEQCEGGGKGER